MNTSHKHKKTSKKPVPPISIVDLASLGDGKLAYIKQMTSEQAGEMFPNLKNLPRGIELFALHGADGTPLALTDSLDAAVGHAIEDELTVTSLH